MKPNKEEFHLHDYSNEPRLRDMPRKLVNWPRIAVLASIRLYQFILAPGLPRNTCRFYPSCSHYAEQSVERYGLISGLFLASKRLIRCNQFFSGGYDPVPPVK